MEEEARLDKIAQEWIDNNLFTLIEEAIVLGRTFIEVDERIGRLAAKIDGIHFERKDILFDVDFPRIPCYFIYWDKE